MPSSRALVARGAWALARRNPYVRAANLAGRGVRAAWKNRKTIKKIGRAFARKFKVTRSNNVVTEQRDVATSGPPANQRTGGAFKKKVDRAISDHAGRQTVVFRGAAFASSAVADAQAVDWLPIFGCNGTTGVNGDLAKLVKYYDELADDDILTTSKNLMFQYGVLEVNFTNRSTTARIIVDVYEWKARKNVTNPSVSMPALQAQLEGQEEILEETVGTPTQMNLTDLGISPYQIPAYLKILQFGKKTTIQLAPSGTSKYTMARKKNRWISGEKILDQAGCMLAGWTEGLLFLTRGVPATGVSSQAVTIDFGFTRKYSWRAMDPHAKNGYVYEIF